MRMLRLCRIVLPLVFAAAASQPAFAQDDEEIFYKVLGEHLICLFEHKDAYLELPDDMLAIDIQSCPDIVTDLKAFLENTGPDLNLDEASDGHDSLIMLSKEELQCLAEKQIDATTDIFVLYPIECKIEPDSESP
ncbi:MAG: hypothetical protein AB3N20_03410 [Rhizobiaceae bacterium]